MLTLSLLLDRGRNTDLLNCTLILTYLSIYAKLVLQNNTVESIIVFIISFTLDPSQRSALRGDSIILIMNVGRFSFLL
jgi:hypothetical protein